MQRFFFNEPYKTGPHYWTNRTVEELREDADCNWSVCKETLCYFLSVALQSNWGLVWLFVEVPISNTGTVTLCRTPPNSDQHITYAATYTTHNTQQTQQPNAHALIGVRTRDRRNETAAHLHLRPHGQRVRRCHMVFCHSVCADTLTWSSDYVEIINVHNTYTQK